jgi:hypothetical protein
VVSFEVDPVVLGQVAGRLTEAVAVAEQVEHHRGSLEAGLGEVGDNELASSLSSFLDDWAYGCGLLAEDAKGLACRLAQASRL